MSLAHLSPFLNNKSNLAKTRIAPGMLLHFLATKDDTNGAFALLEAKAQQGMEPSPHAHAHEDESFLLLEGDLWFRIGNHDFQAHTGDFIFLPRGVFHEMKLLSPTIHALILITPAGFEDYFWQLSQPAQNFEIPPLSSSPPTPSQIQAMNALNALFGISSPSD